MMNMEVVHMVGKFYRPQIFTPGHWHPFLVRVLQEVVSPILDLKNDEHGGSPHGGQIL